MDGIDQGRHGIALISYGIAHRMDGINRVSCGIDQGRHGIDLNSNGLDLGRHGIDQVSQVPILTSEDRIRYRKNKSKRRHYGTTNFSQQRCWT
ncbi:MAG: hypothetical protein H8E57_05345 [Candidatus Cloacimonetes bacterium]|nr:hypothetical protein [Candidatus Cloacimonadota bacterium]